MEKIMKVDVLNRFSRTVQFTAEIECSEDASRRIKLGLAVRWAYKTGACLRDAYLRGTDLRDAYLRGAYLRGACLRDADLRGAYLRGACLRDADLRDADLRGTDLRGTDLIDGGQDSRGYRFVAVRYEDGLRISAGCRWFTLAKAHAHWSDGRKTSPECLERVESIARIARLRGWTEKYR